MDENALSVQFPKTDPEILACFKFAIKYAADYARAKNILRNDPDEVESIAGVKMALALKEYDAAKEGTFQGYLKRLIRNELIDQCKKCSRKLGRAIASAKPVRETVAEANCWRPSSHPPGRERKRQ